MGCVKLGKLKAPLERVKRRSFVHRIALFLWPGAHWMHARALASVFLQTPLAVTVSKDMLDQSVKSVLLIMSEEKMVCASAASQSLQLEQGLEHFGLSSQLLQQY